VNLSRKERERWGVSQLSPDATTGIEINSSSACVPITVFSLFLVPSSLFLVLFSKYSLRRISNATGFSYIYISGI